MSDIFCRVVQAFSDTVFLALIFFCIFALGEIMEDLLREKMISSVSFGLQMCGIFGIFIYLSSIIFLAFLYIIEKIGWIIISAIM